jgi:hypothetical protein
MLFELQFYWLNFLLKKILLLLPLLIQYRSHCNCRPDCVCVHEILRVKAASSTPHFPAHNTRQHVYTAAAEPIAAGRSSCIAWQMRCARQAAPSTVYITWGTAVYLLLESCSVTPYLRSVLLAQWAVRGRKGAVACKMLRSFLFHWYTESRLLRT